MVCGFFAYKKILGRTETRTRDRMYIVMIRSVCDISRGDRARIATCTLRTSTDLVGPKLLNGRAYDSAGL